MYMALDFLAIVNEELAPDRAKACFVSPRLTDWLADSSDPAAPSA